jgi:IMP dehydrogenase
MSDVDFIHEEAITFDDILLVPCDSEYGPEQVNTSSRLTKKITIKSPMVSAAMDTVTESKMAIEMARHGGAGILHRNLSVEEQVRQVSIVKNSYFSRVMNTITGKPKMKLYEIHEICRSYKISGIPITDDQGKLLGIVTNRDLLFEDDLNKSVDEVMTSMPLITSDVGIDDESIFNIFKAHKIEKLPLVDGENKLCGLVTLKDYIRKNKYPNASLDETGRLIVGAAIGIDEKQIERMEKLLEAGIDLLVIDTSHGNSTKTHEMLKRVKREANVEVVCGNVATEDSAKTLLELGADAIKVGVGPGSICTTRLVTGVGVPQITAIIDVKKAVSDMVPIIADGGIRYPGDIAKALACGADTVMLGNMLAGSTESPGDLMIVNGIQYKTYRGMGSKEAMNVREKSSSNYYARDRYAYSSNPSKYSYVVPEGVDAKIHYKGPVVNIFNKMIGGLRNAMSYLNAGDIKSLQENARIVKITRSSIEENRPHDIYMISEGD